MLFSFLMYLHPTLYKNNSSVSSGFLPGHVYRDSRQLIHKTNIFILFNNYKKFLTILNSSFYYNLIFSDNFNFNATCDGNLVVPEYILTHYNELITVFETGK